MERANAGTDDMRSNILIQQVNRSLFIVGNQKRQIRHHREKRDDLSLREKEKQIAKDLEDNILTDGAIKKTYS